MSEGFNFTGQFNPSLDFFPVDPTSGERKTSLKVKNFYTFNQGYNLNLGDKVRELQTSRHLIKATVRSSQTTTSTAVETKELPYVVLPHTGWGHLTKTVTRLLADQEWDTVSQIGYGIYLYGDLYFHATAKRKLKSYDYRELESIIQFSTKDKTTLDEYLIEDYLNTNGIGEDLPLQALNEDWILLAQQEKLEPVEINGFYFIFDV